MYEVPSERWFRKGSIHDVFEHLAGKVGSGRRCRPAGCRRAAREVVQGGWISGSKASQKPVSSSCWPLARRGQEFSPNSGEGLGIRLTAYRLEYQSSSYLRNL